MSRHLLILSLSCLLGATFACSGPKCPPAYMQFGDQCRLCPPGEDREHGKCVPTLDADIGAIEAGGGGFDDEEDAGLTETSDSNSVEDPVQTTRFEEAGVGRDDDETRDAALGDGGTCASLECQAGLCTPDFCLNRGVCNTSTDGPMCDCGDSGFGGAKCESDINECASPTTCSSLDYPCVQTLAPGYTCQGQFADWPIPDAVAGSKIGPDYDIVSTAGVVIDKVTGLRWQRTLPATRFSPQTTYMGCTGTRIASGDSCTWLEAKTYCENLVLGGISDWRLPSKIELESISDHTRFNPAIDAAFPETPIDNFWTSSRFRESTTDVWRVFSGNGSTVGILSPTIASVRCVYGTSNAGTPATRYVVDATQGTVTDTRTNLVWQRPIAPSKHSRTAAIAYCEGLGMGWRLPSLKELLTLVDPSRNFPAIDRTAFPSTPANAVFWSSTPTIGDANGVGWYVSFLNGDSSMAIDDDLAVRCVR